MEVKNKTYQELSDYIKNHVEELNEEELRFLLRYARNIRINNIENDFNISTKTILEDMKKLNEKLQEGDLTPLSYQRLSKEMELFEELISGGDLQDISYELDKLYVDNDMDVREKSALIYSLREKTKMEQKGANSIERLK